MLNKKALYSICTCVLFSVFSASSAVAAYPHQPLDRLNCIYDIITWTNLNVEDVDETVLEQFTDVSDDIEYGYENYMKNSIIAAIENGIVFGYEDNTLRLEEEVTRAEFACMLYRAQAFMKNPPAERLEYKGKYGDVSDWNAEAIYYCIENGYFIGYGDIFGVDDMITWEQLSIVNRRVKEGLTPREKYAWYALCDETSDDPFVNIFASGYEDEVVNEPLPRFYENMEHIIEENSAGVSEELESLLALQANLDYEKLSDEAFKTTLVNELSVPLPPDGSSRIMTDISENGQKTDIEKKIKDAEENKIKRESAFVISPLNNRDVGGIGYGRTVGAGYEYYRYLESGCETPNGETVGQWYRRKVVVDYTHYTSTSSMYRKEIYLKYGDPEEVSL